LTLKELFKDTYTHAADPRLGPASQPGVASAILAPSAWTLNGRLWALRRTWLNSNLVCAGLPGCLQKVLASKPPPILFPPQRHPNLLSLLLASPSAINNTLSKKVTRDRWTSISRPHRQQLFTDIPVAVLFIALPLPDIEPGGLRSQSLHVFWESSPPSPPHAPPSPPSRSFDVLLASFGAVYVLRFHESIYPVVIERQKVRDGGDPAKHQKHTKPSRVKHSARSRHG
jgi:hypothetical protein